MNLLKIEGFGFCAKYFDLLYLKNCQFPAAMYFFQSLSMDSFHAIKKCVLRKFPQKRRKKLLLYR